MIHLQLREWFSYRKLVKKKLTLYQSIHSLIQASRLSKQIMNPSSLILCIIFTLLELGSHELTAEQLNLCFEDKRFH